MNSAELATAGDVDFSRLGHEQKAEVTETFAKAIQREAASREKQPLPTLLDEVFRQDFRRGSSADEEPEEQAASAKEDEKKETDRSAPQWGVSGIASPGMANRQPAPWVRSEPPSRTVETAPQERTTVTASPGRAESARPAASGSTLEDTVRDMLRPLMMQWLDEHMPRILENAIREEIATRGLLPKTEK
jgi:cell pole-organizing protein PopZ